LVLRMAMLWVKTFPFADWREEVVLKFMRTPNPQPSIMDRMPGKENLETL
jgi:hypothetical protein